MRGRIVRRQLALGLGQEKVLQPQHLPLGGGRLDDFRPRSRGNVAAVAPLANGDAKLADVGGQSFGIASPHRVDGLKVL